MDRVEPEAGYFQHKIYDVFAIENMALTFNFRKMLERFKSTLFW